MTTIERFSAMAVGSLLRVAPLLSLLALSACAMQGGQIAQSSSPRSSSAIVQPIAAAVSTAPLPTEALEFSEAVDRLTIALFAHANLSTADLVDRTLVVDPLIDRASGNQVVATQSMEERMTKVVSATFHSIRPQAFSTQSLSVQPLILVGSITPVVGPGSLASTSSPTHTYRIWASLADLRTNRIISHETAWVRADGVNMTPTRFFRDSPSWLADRSQAAYLATCAGKSGDPVNPNYVAGLHTAATVADGVKAYEAGRYREALAHYVRAQGQAGGDQIRVYNGIYLAHAALGHRTEAEKAFGTLVDYGLERGQLAVKFVFQPSTTQFWPDRAVSGAYPMWLRQIASHTTTQAVCLHVVGHTSPTGPAAANTALSLARAEFVRIGLIRRSPPLESRTDVEGRGSAEPIVGSGRDDSTDVLDRRVEFATTTCMQAGVPGSRRG